MNSKFDHAASRQPDVTRTAGVPAITSDHMTAQKKVHDAPQYGSKPVGPILTPVQAGELLGFDEKTVKRWASIGYVPAHPVGNGKKRYWRFFEDELIAWLMDQKNGAFEA